MNERYAHIDKLVAKAEQILALAAKIDDCGDLVADCPEVFLSISRRSLFNGKTRLEVRSGFCGEEWHNKPVLSLLDGKLKCLVLENDWVEYLDDFHTEVMAQSEAKDGAA